MLRVPFLMACVCVVVGFFSHASEIDYSNCKSIRDVIERETEEISSTHPSDGDELAQLYVSRGESYLLDAQHEKAIEDFQAAYSLIGHSCNLDLAMVIAFRAVFGEVVSYDNLGMQDHTKQALEHLQTIVTHVGCNDCLEHLPCQEMITPLANRLHSRPAVNKRHFCNKILSCTNETNKDSYDDILGPNQPPEPNWCEEIVTGVGRAMDAIACLAPNYAVKVVLIGVIETLITRGVKCCQAGGFWKACVAPITRKWREWKNNKERSILPNAQSLPLYIN